MVAVVLTPASDGRVEAAQIAVGACSPVALRLPKLEAKLVGAPFNANAVSAMATEDDLSPLSPIDDIRGGGAYRRCAR